MIALTNSQISGSDGTGAQVLRYAILFSLSRKYEIPWIHSPILKIDSNPGDGMQSPELISKFLKELNSFLTNREKEEFVFSLPKFSIKRPLSKSHLHSVLHFFSKLSKIHHPVLAITLNHPNTYLKHSTDLLAHFSSNYAFSHFVSRHKETKEVQIHLHLRGAFHNDRNIDPNFLLSLLHFVQLEVLTINLNIEIVIHTDFPESSKTWNVPEDQDPGTLQYWKDIGELGVEKTLKLREYDFSAWESVVGKILILRHLDPLNSWKEMAKADILIGCHSSFSIVGALLNSRAFVLIPNELRFMSHWHGYDSNFNNFNSIRVALNDYFSNLSET